MAEYRYLVADLLTDTLREEMPFTGVSYGDILNAPGSFSGNLPLSLKNRAGFEKITRANLDPGRTALYVERDGVLVWGGIVWTVSASDDDFQLTIGAEGFWSYFRRRLIRATKNYAQVDQLAIVQDLVNYAQGISGGNIGVIVGSETSGTLRDRTYNAYERTNLAQAIEDLSAVDGGFDFAIDVSYVSGVRTKTLHLAYPRRGQRTAHVLDLGTNIESLSWQLDATTQSNLIDALGSGEDQSRLISTAADTTLLGSYPLLEDTVSYTDVSVPATLAAHAKSALAAALYPVETLPTLITHGSSDLAIGGFVTGDELQVRSQNAGGFLSINSFYRIMQWTVTVDDNGKEQIAFTYAPTERVQ